MNSLEEVIRGDHQIWLGDAYGTHVVSVSEQLAIHLADQIRAHLLSDEVIDHVQNYVPLGFDPLRDPYCNTHDAARAILTAALQGDA